MKDTPPICDICGVSQWGSSLITILDNGHIGLNNPFKPDASPTGFTSAGR